MGPYHKFVLLDKKIYPVNSKNIMKNYDDIILTAVSLSDYLLSYMSDTLLWIPFDSEEDNAPLNWYNKTNIQRNRASCFKAVIDSWITLFSLAPKEEFMLTCGLTADAGDGWTQESKPPFISCEYAGDCWKLNKLPFLKKDVLPVLKAISNMAETVSQDDNFYILHFGI